MERLTEWKDDRKLLAKTKFSGDFGSANVLGKLAEYEDLEDKLNGISVKQVVDGFIKTIENQTCEGYEHGRILTNAEADKWNEYKQLEEQGLLLRLPCNVGDKAWYVNRVGINEVIVDSFVFNVNLYANVSVYIGAERFGKTLTPYKTLFFSKEEAEQKLKEMESD